MDWNKKVNFIRTVIAVGALSTSAAIFWAMLIVGFIEKVFNLDQNFTFFYVGIPTFIVLEYVFITRLPDTLRKAGMI